MPDVAVLGIKVENGEVVKATASLNSLEVAGAKAEITTGRLSRRMGLAEIEARKMDAAMRANGSVLGKLAASMGLSESATARLGKALGALSVVAAVGFIGRKTLEETEAAQAAMAQLEAAVSSTGGVAGRTVEQLDALSIALQRQTMYSDEAVKGAEAMLLTFDKIRGVEFDRATAAITDLAARMGGDLQGAAVQVGKALQDPTTGLTALRRSGVSFSESQLEVIKQLYETGQVAEGQRVILKELEHQFGGSAAAARDTLGGALAGLKNAFGDLFELTKGSSQGAVDAINGITHAMESSGLTMSNLLTEWMTEWAMLKAGVQEVWAILATPISTHWAEDVKKQIAAIEYDLSIKLAGYHTKAKTGPSTGAAGGAGDEQSQSAKKQREQNEDMVRLAKQAVEVAALEGRAQDMARISYEETNKAIQAQRELKGALLDETLKAIHTEAALKRQAVNVTADAKYAKDLQEIWTKGVEEVVRATSDGIAAMLSSVGALFQNMLARMAQDGQTNKRMEMGAAAISGGLAGFQTGQQLYSTSHGAAGNYARGAIGGAASGAAAGFMVAGPVGAAVGAMAGFVGGIIGVGAAAKAAAKAMAEAQKQVAFAMADLRATVGRDSVAQGIAQIEADREQRRKAIEEAYSGGGSGSEQVRKRLAALAEMNALENARIAQLREEYALMQQRAAEDLQVRLLTAQGRSSEAKALALQLAQQREREDLVKSFGDTIDPTEAATLALLDQVQAQEKLATATNAASSAALNMVQGYKLQAQIFAASSARASGTGMSSYSGPASGGPSVLGGDLTVQVMLPNGSVLGTTVLKDFKRRKDRGDAELGSLLS